ncbi:hypothetical protein K340107D12_52500 [Blautia parvula]|uniref:Uncharacterized protein n=1 Tax=Blautia parvula TaxID=2877527 RepID=A0ABQ0C0X2_9FIRM
MFWYKYSIFWVNCEGLNEINTKNHQKLLTKYPKGDTLNAKR